MLGFNKNLKLHFIGVGGIGMSGIAEVLLNLGYTVSGSDMHESAVTNSLIKKGLTFFKGHQENNIKDKDIVIYSSAIKDNNPEYKKAYELNIPLIKRAEMLAELMRLKSGIAVAGSHGKTTTTSILATILSGLEFSPTYIVGGVVKNLGSNAGLGEGEILVAEADESDGSFHYLNPIITILTNIDNDHIDHYGSIEALVDSFVAFTNKVPFFGQVILNIDDERIRENLSKFNRRYISFGFSDDANYKICDYKVKNSKTFFKISFEGKEHEFSFDLSGKHNVLNCAGAIVVAHKLGKDFDEINKALQKFEGVGRRLETLYDENDLLIIDDYAHHPTEIQKTIEATKNKYDENIKIVFEPHRYTRTRNFWKEFIDVLSCGVEVNVLPIYPAGEDVVPQIDSKLMVEQINEAGCKANFISDISELGLTKSSKGTYLFLGAGPISKGIREVVNGL